MRISDCSSDVCSSDLRSLENQEFRASGLNLLIAAISYWNTVYLDRAAQHLNAVGTTFDAALLAHLSPMGWAHISLTGDYLWEQARRLPARSEEHTSELQSLMRISYAVFCLKNKNTREKETKTKWIVS